MPFPGLQAGFGCRQQPGKVRHFFKPTESTTSGYISNIVSKYNNTYGSQSIAQNNGTANYINISGDTSMNTAVNSLPDMAKRPGICAVVGQVAQRLTDAARGAMLVEAMNPDILGLFKDVY